MPSTAPHLVENGPEPSITISFTYYTDSTRQRELLYRGNARLRRLGITPTPVGESPQRDRVKHAVLSGYTVARNSARRLLGRSIPAERSNLRTGVTADRGDRRRAAADHAE